MELRAITVADLPQLEEIDGTIESTRYLHVERSGEGMNISWKLEERPLREKLIAPSRLSDEIRFLARQIATGAEEGVALLGEHEGSIVAMLIAVEEQPAGALAIRELRVDSDYRRQGLGMALVYALIQQARQRGARAVAAESRSNNIAASNLLAKCGFELAGLDTHRYSNHDLVKEAATLLWYAALD